MNNKGCRFVVDGRIFKQEAVLKTSYLFTNDYYVSIQYTNENDIEILMTPKNGMGNSHIDKEFCNELVAQMVRYDLAVKNKNIRELILGRALYSTCVDFEEDVVEERTESEKIYSIDDIAVNWFDVYEKEEE